MTDRITDIDLIPDNGDNTGQRALRFEMIAMLTGINLNEDPHLVAQVDPKLFSMAGEYLMKMTCFGMVESAGQSLDEMEAKHIKHKQKGN